jgi:hypothetical protein
MTHNRFRNHVMQERCARAVMICDNDCETPVENDPFEFVSKSASVCKHTQRISSLAHLYGVVAHG